MKLPRSYRSNYRCPFNSTQWQGDFCTTVTLLSVNTDDEVTYQIVGDDEADITKNKISVYSPVARGLITKEEGDSVIIQTPSGPVEYEILTIEHL